MKRFSTTDKDGSQITGGIPFYTKDIEFIQDATKDILCNILRGFTTTDAYALPNFQLGRVVVREDSPGEYCNYGGYFFLNNELYYCKESGLVGQNPYLEITEDYVFVEGNRKPLTGEKDICPWRVRHVIIKDEATEFPVSEIPMLNDLLFKSLTTDVENLKRETIYNKLKIETGGERQIPNLINYVAVQTSNQPPTTLILPQPNNAIIQHKRIIIRFDAGGETFEFNVKSGENTLFSHSGSEGAYHTTLVFEFIDKNWLLTSKTDM